MPYLFALAVQVSEISKAAVSDWGEGERAIRNALVGVP
jgi:hypothetical protein